MAAQRVMSLSRLSAGAGYKYLLRHTACGDACREAGSPLTGYYAASGYPVGRWHGRGLVGLDAGRGLAAGTAVAEEAMAALFGTGHDPVNGEALGRPYPAYRNVEGRIAEALAELPECLNTDERNARTAEIETTERARPVRTAVAGFDLTFTVPKSASVLWALGHQDVQTAVMEAHREAVTTVLDLIEERFLHTRVGHGGCAQVGTRGMIAAAFDHWDTRTGDPNLHTHVVIANKVQGADGKWRSVDSRALHHAAVALSEVYDDLIADAISARLPVAWSWRDRGERRSPAFEIAGLPDELLAVFSTRSGQIAAAMQHLIADFRMRHDRDPNRREILRLRQQATLATRPDKTVRPLGELIGRWRTTATDLTKRTPEQIVAAALQVHPHAPAPAVDALAQFALAAVVERRSTWTRANLLAEAARASRQVRTPDPAARVALLDRIVEAAVGKCVALDPPELFDVPHRFRRPDGSSLFARPAEHAYTAIAVLEAEDRLVAATDTLEAPAVHADALTPVLTAAALGMPGARGLTADQAGAVAAIASSGRLLDVLVGPAGSGKTRALRALRSAWENVHGPGSVLWALVRTILEYFDPTLAYTTQVTWKDGAGYLNVLYKTLPRTEHSQVQFALVYDGDQRPSSTPAEDPNRQNWPKLYLPGAVSPDALLRTTRTKPDAPAAALGSDPTTLKVALSALEGIDDHDWVDRLCAQYGPRAGSLRALCRLWVQQNESAAFAFYQDVRGASPT
ncbi:MobF family relaxase [Sporichthya polymorpha]|uniref:MobF family relaxase n=1 Tax=Sporichthya polymorpha TaxID=35751 RepID=UPI0003714C49|nr:MobF family relaxase [Sporichthya polymorpha]